MIYKRILLLLLVLVAMVTGARAKTVMNVTGQTATITQQSTLYVGEVVVDGRLSFYYMYSEDLTNTSTVFGPVRNSLTDFMGGIFSELVPYSVNEGGVGISFCSNSAYEPMMNSDWKDAYKAGQAVLSDAGVVSSSSNDLYQTDAAFAAKCTFDEFADIIDNAGYPVTISGPIGTLSATNTDIVTYTVEGGELVKHIDRHIDYNCEMITVIYTRAELSSPLTFEAVEDGTITVNLDDDVTFNPIQYKLNDADWTDVTWGTPIALSANDIICIRGDNGTCYATDEMNYWAGFHFQPSNPVYVYGNIMSLIDKDGFATNITLTETYTFFHLFQRSDYEPNTAILNHPTKDIVLPATTLTAYCYDGLFADAPNITRAPALPATTLADWCYSEMFSGTAITTAPELPATTLAESCYADMFMNCTSLTTAPDLPASTLVEGCYTDMFAGCSNLSSITCLATDISADYCTTSWVYGVAATGTFVKAADMTGWTTGEDGIPAGWTVRNDGEYTVTIPASGVATFSASENVIVPSGLTAHYCTTYDSEPSTISVKAVSGSVIPSETGVLLRGTAGETYTLTATSDDVEAISGNALVAVPVPTHIAPTDGDYTNFMLKSGEFIKIADSPATNKMPANKAYLQILTADLSSTSTVRGITLNWDDDTATSIMGRETLDIRQQTSNIYDLQGRRIQSPIKKGLYIISNKKVSVK